MSSNLLSRGWSNAFVLDLFNQLITILITNTHLAESFAQQIKGLPVLSQARTASLDGFVSSTFESSQF